MRRPKTTAKARIAFALAVLVGCSASAQSLADGIVARHGIDTHPGATSLVAASATLFAAARRRTSVPTPPTPDPPTVWGVGDLSDGLPAFDPENPARVIGDMQLNGPDIVTLLHDVDTPVGPRDVLEINWIGAGVGDQICTVAFYNIPPYNVKAYAGFWYWCDADTDNTSIVKKHIRFRTYENADGPVEDPPHDSVDAGTIDIFWHGGQSKWQFNGGRYSQAPYNIYQDADSIEDYGPDIAKGQWVWCVMMMDYTDPTTQRVMYWVNGVRVMNYIGNLLSPAGPPIPPEYGSPWWVRTVFFGDTFNSATPRKERVFGWTVANAYLPVPTS